MKQIGFVGIDSTDIVLYLARLLSYNGKKVAIVDYTKRHLVIQTANVPDVLFGRGSYYKDILVVASESLTDDKEVRGCSYVFHYFGSAISHPKVAGCTELFFVTDMVISNAVMLKAVNCTDEVRKRCIIRNAIDVKYKVKFLTDAMGQDINPKEVIEIPYSEADYRNRCYLCIDTAHKLKLKGLSVMMQQALVAVFREWESLDDKEIKKIIKKA